MFGFKFFKFSPNDYVLRYRNGKIIKEGIGLSFICYAPTTSIVVLPVVGFDIPFIFEEVTSDYQTVTVQGQVAYRISDYKKIAESFNYTINLSNKFSSTEDSKRLAQRVMNVSKVLIKKHIEHLPIKDAIRSSEKLAKQITLEIKEGEEINNLGIEIEGFSILAILPNKDTARALEAKTREYILKQADEALYERRNASIEQERIVKENELNTEIAVENKKKQIKESQLDTQRLVMQKENEIIDEKLGYETELEEKRKALIDLTVANKKAEADAKAYELSSMMNAFSGIEPNVMQALSNMGMNPDRLIAIAFQELAEKAEKIGNLNITPDLLQSLMNGKV